MYKIKSVIVTRVPRSVHDFFFFFFKLYKKTHPWQEKDNSSLKNAAVVPPAVPPRIGTGAPSFEVVERPTTPHRRLSRSYTPVSLKAVDNGALFDF